MLIIPKTRQRGVMEYLLTGKMRGRNLTREELDERIIFGDFNITDKLIKSLDYSQNYYHFTLSFAEKKLPSNIIEQITKEFEDFICYGFSKNEYNIYSEAHLPKKEYKVNRKTGEVERRLPHIHVVIPRINLITGTQLKVSETNDTKYFNAFQEYINLKYELKSPKDYLREFKKSKAEILESYGKPEFVLENVKDKSPQSIKKELGQAVEALFKSETLKTYNDIVKWLEKQEAISEVREVTSKNGYDYISIKLKDKPKNIRLKGSFFDKESWDKMGNIKKVNRVSMATYLKTLEQWKFLRDKQISKRYRTRRESEYLTIVEIYKEVIFNSGLEDDLFYRELGRIAFMHNTTGKSYKYIIKDSLLNKKGFWIKQTYFGNIFKNGKWEIRDFGDTIKVNKYGRLNESVSILLDLAQMKDWDIEKLRFSGEEKFEAEMKKQIKERVEHKKKAITISEVDNYISKNNIEMIDPLSKKLMRGKIKRKLEEYSKKQKEKKMLPQTLSEESKKAEALNKSYYIKQLLENLELFENSLKIYWDKEIRQTIIEDQEGFVFSLVEFVSLKKSLNEADTIKLLEKEENTIKNLVFDEYKKHAEAINKLHPSLILNKLHLKENIPQSFKTETGVWLIKYEEKYLPILKYYMEKTNQPFFKAIKDLEALAKENVTKVAPIKKSEKSQIDLKTIKRDINLVEFIARYLGHGVHQTSTSRQKVFKGEGYRISVSQMGNGDWVYKNFDSLSDKGSILDFVKTRESLTSIPEALKRIQEIEGRPLPKLMKSVSYKVSTADDKTKSIETAKQYWKSSKSINNFGFILLRGLDVDIVKKIAREEKTIRQDSKHALVFNLINKDNDQYSLCGVTKFNRNFKQVLGEKGLWVSHKKEYFEQAKVIITETPIDGLAYMSLHKNEKIACISTNGQYSNKALETLVSLAKDAKLQNITLAMDNDDAGKRFNKEISEKLKQSCPDLKINIEVAKGKDWNDDLLKTKKTIVDREI